MALRYPMPSVLSPVVDLKTGRMTPVWVNYLKGLEEVANRTSAFQADLGGGALLADVITKVNDILEALQDASLQETS